MQLKKKHVRKKKCYVITYVLFEGRVMDKLRSTFYNLCIKLDLAAKRTSKQNQSYSMKRK